MKKQKVATGMIDAPRIPGIQEMEATRAFVKFKAATLDEYQGKLKGMTKGEIYKECERVGIRSALEVPRCIVNLTTAYKNARALYERYKPENQTRAAEYVAPVYPF